MIVLPRSYTVKAIAVVLSILIIWQSVVWADPSVAGNHDRLQPLTLFSSAEGVEGFPSAAVSYLIKIMSKIEQEPDNRNLFRIKERADEAVDQLRRVCGIKGLGGVNLPVVVGDPGAGEVIIEGDVYRIRYFNQRMLTAERPERPYRLVSEKVIGEYLARQVLVHEDHKFTLNEEEDPGVPPPKGQAAQGTPETGKDADPQDDALEGPGYGALFYLWERLGIKHCYFTIAPFFEELFKVGIPFAVFYTLDWLSITSPSVNENIFHGMILFMAAIFVTSHVWNQRNGKLPTDREAFYLLAAPVFVATGAGVISLVCVEFPGFAILFSWLLHLATNITVALIKKISGNDLGFASFSGRGKDYLVIKAALKLAEGQQFLLNEYDFIKQQIKLRFGVDLQAPEYKEARVEIAKICAAQYASGMLEKFHIFGFDPRTDKEEIAAVAEVCAQSNGESTAKNFSKFGFEMPEDKEKILVIALLCADQSGQGTARYFPEFGFVRERDLIAIEKVATECARQNGSGTASNFEYFGLSPSRSEREKEAVKRIARACIENNSSGAASYFFNFGFKRDKDADVIEEFALLCARYHALSAARYFRSFSLNPAADRDAILRIAKTCASWDAEGTMKYFRNFGLNLTDEEMRDMCMTAERRNLSALALTHVAHPIPFPIHKALGENGETFLAKIDDVYDSLDLSGLSMGAHAYVRALMLERACKADDISDDFTAKLRTQVVPALRAMENITADYPTMGVQFTLPRSSLASGEWESSMFRVMMMNYIGRGKIPNKMERSYLWQDGENQIRVPPAPYPVERMLVNKLIELRLVREGDYKITMAGDHMKEALFIFNMVHYAGSEGPYMSDAAAFPRQPWVVGGRGSVTIDPWSGIKLDEDDARTHGMQTQFYLSATIGPIESKMEEMFAIVGAAAAYLGEYGIKDGRLKKAYAALKEEMTKFLEGRIGIARAFINSRLYPPFDKMITYEFDTREPDAVFSGMGRRLRASAEDNSASIEEKGRLHKELKNIVEGHTRGIISEMLDREMSKAMECAIKGDFAGVKQAVLSACFGSDEARKRALPVARAAYPEEYAKILEAERSHSKSRALTADAVKDNAAKAVSALVNAFIGVAEKKEKVVIALDLDLGEGEINTLLRALVDALPSIEHNNEDIRRFFRNLEIVKGQGSNLAARVSQITDPRKGSVKPENLIVITTGDNLEYYRSFEGRATLAGIDDRAFPETAYLPLLEVTLFAVGKYLGWDDKTLRKYYAMIPNVISLDRLEDGEIQALFGKDTKTLIIRLIPDAVTFNKAELRELIDSIKTILTRA